MQTKTIHFLALLFLQFSILKESLGMHNLIRSISKRREKSYSEGTIDSHLQHLAIEMELGHRDELPRLIKIEQELENKMHFFANKVAKYEIHNTDVPDEMGRQHQVYLNALQVAYVYADILYEIYPVIARELRHKQNLYNQKLPLYNQYEKERKEASRLRKQGKMVVNNEDHSDYIASFDQLNSRINGLNKAIETIEKDWKMVGVTEKGEANMADVYYHIKRKHDHTEYRQKFLKIFIENRKKYVQKALESVKNEKERNPLLVSSSSGNYFVSDDSSMYDPFASSAETSWQREEQHEFEYPKMASASMHNSLPPLPPPQTQTGQTRRQLQLMAPNIENVPSAPILVTNQSYRKSPSIQPIGDTLRKEGASAVAEANSPTPIGRTMRRPPTSVLSSSSAAETPRKFFDENIGQSFGNSMRKEANDNQALVGSTLRRSSAQISSANTPLVVQNENVQEQPEGETLRRQENDVSSGASTPRKFATSGNTLRKNTKGTQTGISLRKDGAETPSTSGNSLRHLKQEHLAWPEGNFLHPFPEDADSRLLAKNDPFVGNFVDRISLNTEDDDGTMSVASSVAAPHSSSVSLRRGSAKDTRMPTDDGPNAGQSLRKENSAITSAASSTGNTLRKQMFASDFEKNETPLMGKSLRSGASTPGRTLRSSASYVEINQQEGASRRKVQQSAKRKWQMPTEASIELAEDGTLTFNVTWDLLRKNNHIRHDSLDGQIMDVTNHYEPISVAEIARSLENHEKMPDFYINSEGRHQKPKWHPPPNAVYAFNEEGVIYNCQSFLTIKMPIFQH